MRARNEYDDREIELDLDEDASADVPTKVDKPIKPDAELLRALYLAACSRESARKLPH
ncbi:MAG TPA: hypothetical protein VIL20_09825 [Sandaracinaceae bacterium]